MNEFKQSAIQGIANYDSAIPESIASQYQAWLVTEIEKLSIETLRHQTITCTACPKVTGDYLVDFQGQTIRLKTPETYAFLKFVQAVAE